MHKSLHFCLLLLFSQLRWIKHHVEAANVDVFKTGQCTIAALLCCDWCSSFKIQNISPCREWNVGGVCSVSRAHCHTHHDHQNKRHKKLSGVVLCFTSYDLLSSCPMFQLGTDFCWGLAATVSNRQLNIYIPLSSSKQTPFEGSVVQAVKLLYLCACLHNFYNIFTLNQCKFYLNHDLA